MRRMSEKIINFRNHLNSTKEEFYNQHDEIPLSSGITEMSNFS